MKRFARYAMALALMAAIPTRRWPKSLSDNNPKTGGYGAQNLYLQNVVPVTLTINPACTTLDTSNAISFGSTQPTTATPLQAPFLVSWNCSQGVNPRLYFQSTNGLAAGAPGCLMTNGSNQISTRSSIRRTAPAARTTARAPASTPTCSTATSATGSGAAAYWAQVPQLISNNGFTYPATGNYSDNLNVYLEF